MTPTAPRYSAVIQDEPAAEIDAATAFAQIGNRRMYALGARDRMHAERYAQFDATLFGRRKLRVIITITPADTYSVEIGRVGTGRRLGQWTSLKVVRDVYADALGEIIERAVEQQWSQ